MDSFVVPKVRNANLDFTKALALTPASLMEWLIREYYEEIPETLTTPSDMKEASDLMLRLTARFSSLRALSAYAKIDARTKKALGKDHKSEWESAVDRKEGIDAMCEILKQQYAAVSRAVTIYVENARELQMNAEGRIAGRESL